jgi:uncharacterized protein YqhQ
MSKKSVLNNYGGQAVIEGVMMRGAHVAAVAVRRPDGTIAIHEEKLNPALYRGWVSKVPFLRGLIGLWDALGLGTKSLLWSASVAAGQEDSEIFSGSGGGMLVAVSMSMSAGLFFVTPAAGSNIIGRVLGVKNPLVLDVLEGGVKLALFIGYIAGIGRLDEVKRLFAYHGSEHKTINAYEAGEELIPSRVQLYPLEHPRCGTAFLLNVVMLSIAIHALVGRPRNFFSLLLSRMLMIPVISGIAYEILRFTASHADHPLIRLLIQPNLALQGLTTRQPDDAMLEVAIQALERVLQAEEKAQHDQNGQPESSFESASGTD